MATSPPSEPAPTCEPWHDTPVCPLERGGMPCMGPLTAADELLGPEELWCCACGRKSAATPDEVAQAKRADAAWEVEQDRIMRRPGLSDAQDGYQHMPDRVHDRESPDLESRCQECGEAGAKACSYKCGAVLCDAHGAEHQPPDCPPQMDEYLRDTAGSGGEP